MKPRQSASWRKLLPASIQIHIEALTYTTFFLLDAPGPSNFIVQDSKQKVFKVCIGNNVVCSCDPLLGDHCIHSIYCMVKILKVGLNEPILWQKEYSDYELSDIVQGKYSDKSKAKSRLLDKLVLDDETDYRIRGEEDCPICQQPFQELSSLSKCTSNCKGTFHLQCVMVWVKHKQSEFQEVNCPMCRGAWGKQKLSSLQNQIAQHQRKEKLNTFYCSSCKQKIKDLFVCLQCPEYFLCFACHKSQAHHHQLFAKIAHDYQIFRNRQPASMGVLEAISSYCPQYVAPQRKEISKHPPHCAVCLRSMLVRLRKLPCGHYLDQNCLRYKVQYKDFNCNEDKKSFCPGLSGLEARKEQLVSFNDKVREARRIIESKEIEKRIVKLSTQRKSYSHQKRRSSVTKQMDQMKVRLDFIKQTEISNNKRAEYHDSLMKLIDDAEVPKSTRKAPSGLPRPKKR